VITDRRTEFEATLDRTAEARGQEAGHALPRASLLGDALYRFSRNRAAVAAAISFVVLVGYCYITPLVSSESAYNLDFSQAYLSPSWAHPFGTDEFGRDLFLRTALGGQVSIEIGFGMNSVLRPSPGMRNEETIIQ